MSHYDQTQIMTRQMASGFVRRKYFLPKITTSVIHRELTSWLLYAAVSIHSTTQDWHLSPNTVLEASIREALEQFSLG